MTTIDPDAPVSFQYLPNGFRLMPLAPHIIETVMREFSEALMLRADRNLAREWYFSPGSGYGVGNSDVLHGAYGCHNVIVREDFTLTREALGRVRFAVDGIVYVQPDGSLYEPQPGAPPW